VAALFASQPTGSFRQGFRPVMLGLTAILLSNCYAQYTVLAGLQAFAWVFKGYEGRLLGAAIAAKTCLLDENLE
jgi:hypothetical protein